MSSDGLEDYVRILKTKKIVVKKDGIELYQNDNYPNAVIRGNTTVEKLQKRFPDLEIVEDKSELRSLREELESIVGE